MRLSRIERNFEALAAEDPLWTVLADNSKRGGKWDRDAFYQTGEDEIADLERRLGSIGIRLGGVQALDFGCGVGRLSFPLSRRFERCLGIDISKSMIREAQRNVGRGADCAFAVNTTTRLESLGAASIDFAYSDIVFQHMPPRYAKAYFREIARCLKPGGRFVFQLPSHLDQRLADNRRPFRLLRKRIHNLIRQVSQTIRPRATPAYFEMNAIPAHRLIRYVEQRCQLQLIAAWQHPAAAPTWISYLYVFEKPSA